MPERTRIILASSSPFRKALLERLQLSFDVDVPGIDESSRPGESPQAYVERLAVEKAEAVAVRHPRALVIGSDQAAVHDGAIVGKPVDHDDAVRQLQHASGGVVTLYTAVALMNTETGRIQSDVVPFTVHFRRFDRDTIERYLDKEKPYGCAGSLCAEGLGIALLRKFEGDDPNALIGLPLIRLVDMLETEGVRVP